MSALEFRFEKGAIHFPALRLWLDAHHRVGPSERVFVSHAHSDHTARHARVLFSAPTQQLMRARVPGEREEQVLELGRAYTHVELGHLGPPFALTLLPAGHILGSTMSWLEAEGTSLLYTGDFKLRPGRSAEACEPRRADILIMETTFGRPEYRFPSTDTILAGVVRFCREAVEQDEIPVLLGYSLGKAQEILTSLNDTGLPVMLSEPVAKLTRIYESFGLKFPSYVPFTAGAARGHVVIGTPGTGVAGLRQKLGRCRIAVLTGWAVDPGCRFRYQADAAFPLSDHADFPELIEFVNRVRPRRIFTLHGFAADFAAHLRGLGFDACALSESEQLELALIAPRSSLGVPVPLPEREPNSPLLESADPTRGGLREPDSFRAFAQLCSALSAAETPVKRIELLADILQSPVADATSVWIRWLVDPLGLPPELLSGERGRVRLRNMICAACQVSVAVFLAVDLKHNDLGETTAELFAHRPRPRSGLRLSEVNRLFDRLAGTRDLHQCQRWLTESLSRCEPVEAKWLLRLLTGPMRIGLTHALVSASVAQAFSIATEEVHFAHQCVGSFADVVGLAQAGRLNTAQLVPFRPVTLMQPTPAADLDDLGTHVRAWAAAEPDLRNSGPALVWVERFSPGWRCQLHCASGRVVLFDRERREVTESLSEIADAARTWEHEVILDGVVTATESGRRLSARELQNRLQPGGRDLFTESELNLDFVAVDLLWSDGVSRVHEPLERRRMRLEVLIWPPKFRLSQVKDRIGETELESWLQRLRGRGTGGSVVKQTRSPYLTGSVKPSWIVLGETGREPRESSQPQDNLGQKPRG